MNHPLRENLEIASCDGAQWIFCKPCQHKYCRGRIRTGASSPKLVCFRRRRAGQLMNVLNGDYLLRQFYCPSCAVLLDTDFVEEKSHG